MDESLKKKLISIVNRPRKLLEDPRVLVPDGNGPIAADALFPSGEGRHILELGSGWGEFAIEWKKNHPNDSYIAFEMKPERVKKFLKKIDKNHLTDFRILPVNFNWFLEDILPDNAFDLIIVNFPDPWPRRRHWKHRLVNESFPDRIKKILKTGGGVYLATDYGPYARKILKVFRQREDFEPGFGWPGYLRQKPEDYPSTRFELLHLAEGKRPYYQLWRVTQ